MRKYFRQAGYFAAILILLPYVVTILLNGRSSLAQDNGTSPYVTVKSDEKNRKISLDEYGIGILAKEIEGDAEEEALKAQAVLIRTSIYKSIQDEGTSTVLTKEYWTRQQMESNWGADHYGEYYENELKKAGIHVLVNGSEEIPVNGMKLRLYGMELPFGCYKKGWKVCPLTTGEMEERIGSAETDAYCILMAHHPLYAETYWKWGADLVLSGHLHGGIARLPLLGGVISPQFRLFPRYSGDCYEKDGKYIVVSKGLGTHTINFRFWNPAELVVLDIIPAFLYNK